MSELTRAAIAQLREELEQQRTRAEAAEAELRELRMKHGALATVAGTLLSYSHDLGDYWHCRVCDVDRLQELLADEGGEWVEKAHCDTIEVELRDLRRVVDAWKAATEEYRKAVDAMRESSGPDGVLLKLSASVHSAAAVVRNALEALRHA